MNRLARAEFKALVTKKTPVAELPDKSHIELTVGKAMNWFDQAETFSRPSFIMELDSFVCLGETKKHGTTTLSQVGGRQ